MKKICVVSGSRSEYGFLFPILDLLRKDGQIQLQLVITGSHLSGAHGSTVRDLKRDGFKIAASVPILSKDDSRLGASLALAKAVAGLARAFKRLKPDMVLVPGDRYEALAAAQAALLAGIPVAHIGGGDTTRGAFDESIRHAITKMSHLHFATHVDAARRIVKMGEDARHVFITGNPTLDRLKSFKPFSRSAFELKTGFELCPKNLLVTFHPVTVGRRSSALDLAELFAALGSFRDYGILFTLPNADPEGRVLAAQIRAFCARHPRAKCYASLGSELYFNALHHCDAVVGNSSSGLYEAPSFGKPTVDIGERQAGRLAASSVFRCEASRAAIREAIEKALKTDCSGTVNPYGDGEAAGHILSVLKSVKYPRLLLAKAFSESDPTRERTLVIAEAGVNHNGSVERAMKLIDAAADAGADVVKFQTFRAELVVTGSAPKAEYQNRTTPVKESQLDMIRALQLSEASHRRMIAHAKKRGIEFLSTPFDEPSVDFLVKGLKLRRLKVPSGEITNAPLLLKVASTGLPLIISTGMATTDEVRRALGVVAFGYLRPNVRPSREAFEAAYFSLEGRMVLSERVTLLQCTTEYPSPYDEANILVMDAYREIFGLRAGLSDHTPGIQVAIAAVARGAAVIEKHMTLSRSLPGPDHKASLEPHEFKSLVQATRRTQSALGSGIKSLSASEAKNVPIARKSLVTLRAVSAGEKFTRYSVTAKRPGTGIDPFCFWEVVGKRAARNIAPDEVIASEAIHGFSER